MEESLSFIEIQKKYEKDSPESGSQFFSELLSLFFKNQTPNEAFKTVSKLIILLLSIPEKEVNPALFQDNTDNLVREIYYEFKDILSHESEDEVNNYFKTLEKVPPLISDCPELTNKQKLDYCNVERSFMKLYLRDLLVKLKKHEMARG